MLEDKPTGVRQASNKDVMNIYRGMHRRIIDTSESHAIVLDLKVVENPVLEADENYNRLRNHIKLYNRKVQQTQLDPTLPPVDSYETETYNSLYRILGEINTMSNKQNQIQRLEATKAWFEEQERLINSRQMQGIIRYKTLRRRGLSLQSSPNKYEDPDPNKMVIPSDVLAATLLPYSMKWRSSHKEHGVPSERVTEYKRKILNIQPILEQKTMPLLNANQTRVLYPRPVKPVVEEEVKEEEKIDEENKEEGLPPGEAGGEAGVDEKEEPPMLGEEPEEPEQPEQAEGEEDDKLAPKNKLYVDPISIPVTSRIPNDIEARGTFVFSEPDKCRAERAMQLRFKKLQDAAILQVKEDQERIDMINIWSKGRSRMTKELQKRLELIALQPNYKYSEEENPPPFCLSEEEQKKFSFSTATARSNTKQVDLSLQLPRINDRPGIEGYESTIEKPRLRDLKKRFSHMLNLTTDVEERDVPKSLCQYSARFKSFSAVLEEHSKEKQRNIQMEEVRSIKQRLTKGKLGVNITTLAHGLCLPDYLLNEQSEFPVSNLPSNPFMVEKKKKKKKK